jgi:hypothetical protein
MSEVVENGQVMEVTYFYKFHWMTGPKRAVRFKYNFMTKKVVFTKVDGEPLKYQPNEWNGGDKYHAFVEWKGTMGIK